MNIPIINNHLKKKFILIGKTSDIEEVYFDFLQQGIKATFICNISQEQNSKIDARNISVVQCREICASDGSAMVLSVSSDSDNIINELKELGVPAFTLEEFKQLHYSEVGPRACHLEEMYIDRYGDIHCCCKTYLGNVIGNLMDPDITEKILNYSPSKPCKCTRGSLASAENASCDRKVKLASIELSSICNAKCIYCFQNDVNRNEPYKFYSQLYSLIDKLKIPKLMFAGGEILVQPDSLRFIEKIRENDPNKWIHLKSNGCSNKKMVPIVENIFNSTTITLNGFSDSTCMALMDVAFLPVKVFCEELSRSDISLGIKFLCSPANISELPDFLKWSIELNPDRIIVPCARIYSCKENAPNEWKGSSFDGLNMAYWKDIYSRVGNKCKKILNNAKNDTNVRIAFDFDTEIMNMLGIERSDFGE